MNLVARTWQDVRADVEPGRLDQRAVRAHRRRLLDEERAYRLAELRRMQHLTQQSLAEAMGVGQPRVSQIEHGDLDRTEISTLRAYVEALGGSVQIVVEIDGAEVRLT